MHADTNLCSYMFYLLYLHKHVIFLAKTEVAAFRDIIVVSCEI